MKKVKTSGHESFVNDIEPEGEAAEKAKGLRFRIGVKEAEGPQEGDR
jgi:hypothetical protein